MIDAAKLYSLLEKATTVEEESYDIRFEEVVSLVDEERLSEASTLIVSILKEGNVDLRLVMYLFYAQFINQGIGSLKMILPAIQTTLNEHWEKISPVNMRDKYLLSSLIWFLSAIGKKIKRSEKLYKSKKTDDFWNKSVHALNAKMIDELIVHTREFATFVIKKTEAPSINQYILFISKWLENLKGVVEHDTAPPQEEALSSEEVLEESVSVAPSLQRGLDVSEPMTLLLKKIQAFELLVEKEDFVKAALVADDISATLKNFDPALFFPKLFSKYFALFATHIDTLAQEWEAKNSLKWEALQRLYQTDLSEFIEW